MSVLNLKVKIAFENGFGKDDLKNYFINTLGQAKVASNVKFISETKEADYLVDLTNLDSREQIANAMPTVLQDCWDIYYKKNKPRHGGKHKQKKFRKYNNR